jgi:hypothetical protein
MLLSVVAFIQHTLFFIPGQIIVKPILYAVIDWKKVAKHGPQSCVEHLYEDYLSKGFVLSGLKVIAAAISVFMTICVGGVASTTCFDYHVDLGLIKDQRPRPMATREPEVAPIGPKEGSKLKSDSYWTATELEDFEHGDLPKTDTSSSAKTSTSSAGTKETSGSAGTLASGAGKEKDRKLVPGEVDTKHRAASAPLEAIAEVPGDGLAEIDTDAV